MTGCVFARRMDCVRGRVFFFRIALNADAEKARGDADSQGGYRIHTGAIVTLFMDPLFIRERERRQTEQDEKQLLHTVIDH